MPTLTGLTSFGARCGQEGIPTVFTRVSGHIEWLRSTPAVFYTSKGVVGEKSGSCSPGEFVFSQSREVKFCRKCPEGFSSPGGGVSECTRCKKNCARK